MNETSSLGLVHQWNASAVDSKSTVQWIPSELLCQTTPTTTHHMKQIPVFLELFAPSKKPLPITTYVRK